MNICILGATSTIAFEFGKQYASKGDNLYLVGRNKEKLESVVKDYEARGATVFSSLLDLADFNNHEELVNNVLSELKTVDILFVAYGSLAPQEDCQNDTDLLIKEINTNFTSAAALVNRFVPHFESRRTGTIAVITSVAGDRGRQSNYVYGSAKGGLSVYLQGLRNRLFKSGVHVIDIKPGFVITAMTKDMEKNFLFAEAPNVAKSIVAAIRVKRNIFYVPFFWQGIMFIIKSIPEFVFKRLSL